MEQKFRLRSLQSMFKALSACWFPKYSHCALILLVNILSTKTGSQVKPKGKKKQRRGSLLEVYQSEAFKGFVNKI